MKLLKNQFSIVDVNQVFSCPEKDNGRPTAIYIGLGQEVYPLLVDTIEMSHEADVRWYDESLDGKQSRSDELH